MPFLIAGCGPHVVVDYEPKQAFQSLRTYQILTDSQIKTEDIRLNSPLVSKRILRAIQTHLQQRNFQELSTETDFYVSYILQSKQEILSSNSGVSFGYGRGFGHHTRGGFGMIYTFPNHEVYTYDKAILTIDILDPQKQLIWRGSSSYVLDSTSTPESVNQKIQKIVDHILAKFPPQSLRK